MYIDQNIYQNAEICEVRFVDEAYPDSFCFAQEADRPTPLPLYPDEEHKIYTLPYGGEQKSPAPAKNDDSHESGEKSYTQNDDYSQENDKFQNGANDDINENDAPKVENRASLEDVLNMVYQKQFVEAARVIETEDGQMLIAVLAAPFYLKSERDGARLALEREINALIGEDKAVVSFDMYLYRKADDDLSDDEKHELINSARRR